MTIHSLDTQIAEVRREIQMRRQVYPSQVRMRRMKEGEAELKIAIMESVVVTLLRLREERGQSGNG